VLVGLLRDDASAAVRSDAIHRIREIIQLQSAAAGDSVVVLPILVSAGEISDVTVPADLAGLPVVYRGEPLLPHPSLVRWVEARVREPWPASVAPVRVRGARAFFHPLTP
jgi:sirohydrochlorin ferrochelatase